MLSGKAAVKPTSLVCALIQLHSVGLAFLQPKVYFTCRIFPLLPHKKFAELPLRHLLKQQSSCG